MKTNQENRLVSEKKLVSQPLIIFKQLVDWKKNVINSKDSFALDKLSMKEHLTP